MKAGNILKFGVIITAFILLCACEKKEVVYVDNQDENISEEQEIKDDTSVSGNTGGVYDPKSEQPIADMINITDSYKWKEDIILNEGGSAILSAKISVEYEKEPVVVYTEKHSFTNADKKTIANYFFEQDSIKLDLDEYPTKESVQKKLDSFYEIKERVDENKYGYMKPTRIQQEFLEREEQALLTALSDAPISGDISAELKDYSGKYFAGMSNGIEAGLRFETNTDNDVSGFIYEVKNYKDVVKTDSDILFATQHAYGEERENHCEMTREQMYELADKTLKGLGIDNMTTWYSEDLTWCLENGEYYCDGYKVAYIPKFDEIIYYMLNNNNLIENYGYINTFQDIPVYPDEYVEVWINDSGVIRMVCYGLIDVERITTTKLLGYEQIKECVREAVRNKPGINGTNYGIFSFTYHRTIDKDKNGSYIYLPIWVLDDYQGNSIAVNAIDGTVLDAQEYFVPSFTRYEEWESDYNSQWFYEYSQEGK